MLESLPRRERQVLDALFAIGTGGAEQIRAAMSEAPSNSAVRAMLSRLEAKGFVARRLDNNRNVYHSAIEQADARASVLRQVVRTFFDGSAVGAATALLGMTEKIGEDELQRLESAIRRARGEL